MSTSASKPTVIIPLASQDFDPSEPAVCWQVLTDNGFDVAFATQDGKRAQADPMMISGEGLDPWGWIPVLKKLKLIGLTLRADGNARKAFEQMELAPQFEHPRKFSDLKIDDYAGLVLPGGHAPQMRPFLEDKQLQQFIADFFDADKPVAAVCHGVILAARAISSKQANQYYMAKKPPH